jgi:hypothetical protein
VTFQYYIGCRSNRSCSGHRLGASHGKSDICCLRNHLTTWPWLFHPPSSSVPVRVNVACQCFSSLCASNSGLWCCDLVIYGHSSRDHRKILIDIISWQFSPSRKSPCIQFIQPPCVQLPQSRHPITNLIRISDHCARLLFLPRSSLRCRINCGVEARRRHVFLGSLLPGP